MADSNWENCKARSNYHFDPFGFTSQADRMRYVGRFQGNWADELAQAVANAKGITWRTRDPKDNPRGGAGIDSTEADIYIAPQNMGQALNGDRVKVRVFKKGKKLGSFIINLNIPNLRILVFLIQNLISVGNTSSLPGMSISRVKKSRSATEVVPRCRFPSQEHWVCLAWRY